MARLTIYLDAETEQIVAQRAQASGMSKSFWIAKVLKNHVSDEWPETWLDLAGRFPDFPMREELDEAPTCQDVNRVQF